MSFIEINVNEINNFKHIIDIREEFEYLKKHLSGSINIPFAKLIINPNKYLNKDDMYLLICEYGIKSKKTCEILNKEGFNTYNLIGGISKLKL